MIINYKGFEIDYQLWGGFSDDEDTIKTHINYMKFHIDEYLKDPSQSW